MDNEKTKEQMDKDFARFLADRGESPRGYMGGGTVGGGDPDDADREPECEVCRGAKKEPACAACGRVNCDADATGKCPITGEEADDGYNTVGEGDHLL